MWLDSVLKNSAVYWQNITFTHTQVRQLTASMRWRTSPFHSSVNRSWAPYRFPAEISNLYSNLITSFSLSSKSIHSPTNTSSPLEFLSLKTKGFSWRKNVCEIWFQRNTNKNNTIVSATPLFLFTSGDVIIKLLQISKNKKPNRQEDCRPNGFQYEKTIDGLDGTRITNITQNIRTFDGR